MEMPKRTLMEHTDRKTLRALEDSKRTIINLSRYCLSQGIEEFKALISYFFFYLLKKREKSLLLEIRRRGFVVIKGYDFGISIDELEINCDNAKAFSIDVLELPGSFRFKRLEKYNEVIKKITANSYLKKLNFFYTFRYQNSTAMLGETSLEDKKNRDIKRDDYFAGYPHFDLYIRQLKVAVALTEVSLENGPTEFIPYSSGYKFEIFSSYFSSWLALKKIVVGGKPFLPLGFYDSLKSRYKPELITKDRGDILIFDSRNFHKATPLIADKRKILWLYY